MKTGCSIAAWRIRECILCAGAAFCLVLPPAVAMLVSFVSGENSSSGTTLPVELTVGDFIANPLGYNLENLCFNWKLPALDNPVYQSAYQIRAAKLLYKLTSAPDVWDSGRVNSSESIRVPYKGPTIVSGQKIYWSVRFWDQNGVVSEWSEPAHFEAGLQSNAEWGDAQWIMSPIGLTNEITRPAYMRKTVVLRDSPVKARLYMASRGIAESRINGMKVGDDFWSTGWTDFHIRIQVNTYDVISLLKSGTNTLGAIVADGWYSGRLGFVSSNPRGLYGKRPEYAALLKVDYADGASERFVTDSGWKCGTGPVLMADIYDGETYDAAQENPLWDTNELDDAGWINALVTESIVDSPVLLEPYRSPPIRTAEELEIQNITEPTNKVFVFDFGQNFAGVPHIKFTGRPRQVLKVRYAEMLNDDGTLYTDNYRTAKSKDEYTAGDGSIIDWIPSFTYHGFRYVELRGFLPSDKPDKTWMKGLVWHNEMKPTGEFSCSDESLNRLQSCIVWGQKSNYFSVPTDCPQRDERLGWTGDAQVFARTAGFNMDVSAFFTKWLLDLRDGQRENGAFPNFAPSPFGGAGSAGWGDAGVICPLVAYSRYGDIRLLADSYESMKRWIDFHKKESKNLVKISTGFGDWLQPYETETNTTPKDLISTAYFAYSTELTAQVAELLGKTEEAKQYRTLAADIRTAFNGAFVQDGRLTVHTQTAYLLALGFDLLPENIREEALNGLLEAIDEADGHLRTGFLGTPLLNKVLSRFGKTDTAYSILLKETYPGWLFTLNQGATTMWERWNSYSKDDGFGSAGMNSFNHYAYGAIGEWMYAKIGGLELSEDLSRPAYKETVFAPEPGGGITWACVRQNTPYGLAASSWRIEDGMMLWDITIAPNTYGRIVFPAADASKVSISGRSLAEYAAEKRLAVETANGRPMVRNIPNGTYQISITL